MNVIPHLNCTRLCRFSIGLLAVAGLAAAQDQAPHAWRSVDDPPPAAAPGQPAPYQDQAGPNQPGSNQPDYSVGQEPNLNAQQDGPQNYPPPPPVNAQVAPGAVNPGGGFNAAPQNSPQAPYPAQPQGNYPPPPNYAVPATLTIKPGTYITVRTNQWLSSDHNQQGDTFTATLEQPIVVDGFVVARPGQTVYGRVTEAQKAGRVEGTSHLGLQLTQLTLADGQQQSFQSEMVTRNGQTSVGRDAAAVGGTTALGAAIGAGVGWGTGAAIGAGAGAAAGVIGVLLTRGRPTVIYPETSLTFQIQGSVPVSTAASPQAFQYVTPQDYSQPPAISSNRPAPYGAPYGSAVAPPPAGYYGYGYGGYYPPYAYAYPYPYYGGFSVFVGPRYGYVYGPRFYGGYRVYRH